MEENKKFPYKQYIIVGVVLIILAYFIFSGGINIILSALTPLMIALIIAYILNPLVNFFQKKGKLSRTKSAVVAFVIFILSFVVMVSITVPAIADTVVSLKNSITTIKTDEIQSNIENIPVINKIVDVSKLENFTNYLSDFTKKNGEKIADNALKALDSIKGIIVSIVFFLLGVIISFYALRDLGNTRSKIYKLVGATFPKTMGDRIIRVISLTDDCMKKYLVGRMYTAIILGVVMAIACYTFNFFTDFDIPYVPLIALLIGIGNLVPYVGAILATTPAVIIASLNGLTSVIALLIILACIQFLDNFLVTPKVVGDSVGLKGFWVIISIVLGGRLFGLAGIVFAVPIVAVFITLIKEYRDRNDVVIIDEIKKEIDKRHKKFQQNHSQDQGEDSKKC